MKKNDWICLLAVIVFFGIFIFIPPVYELYQKINLAHPYLMAYLKFFLLAPFGEMLGLRIRKGTYLEKGFGIIPRAIVWGFLGISIKIAFDIFAHGVPPMLIKMGFNIAPDVLLHPLGRDKVFTAFVVSLTLNIFYAPILMVTHKLTDEHILETDGKLSGFFKPFRVGYHFTHLNWKVQWEFTFKRVIPLFWIPAQWVNFLCPEELRILIAAFYSIILGIFLAIASIKSRS